MHIMYAIREHKPQKNENIWNIGTNNTKMVSEKYPFSSPGKVIR